MHTGAFSGAAARALVRRLAPAFAFLLVLAVPRGECVPTSPADARKAAARWLERDARPLGAALSGRIGGVRTLPDASGGALAYVIALDPEGFIVVSPDTLVEPIVAFAAEGSYDPSSQNPLHELVERDLGGRLERVRNPNAGPVSSADAGQAAERKWEMLLADAPAPVEGLGSVSDPRVDPLVLSKWSQTVERCYGSATYNYYTPPGPAGSGTNYPCGCVATAMAQLMRYWQLPASGVGTASFSIRVCGGTPYAEPLLGGDGAGGPYVWSEMDLDPCLPDLATKQAIGRLCHDAAISVNMDFCSGGSSADTLQSASALKDTFGYTNAKRGYNAANNIPSANLNAMINPNLHAGYPVILGITGSAGGHAVVCDGYGYQSSTLYHHLNLGWAGAYTAWYNLPNIDTSPAFTSVYKCVYNVFTSGTGEIIAGRVTDGSGSPIAGATVSAGGTRTDVTDSRGIYALRVNSNASYTVSVTYSGCTFTPRSISTGTSSDNSINCGNRWPEDFAGTCCSLPAAPSNPGSANVTQSSIRWTWADNSVDETGFKVYADQGACPPASLRATTSAGATYWDYAPLSANCLYCFQAAAANACGDSEKTACISRCTLAGPPSYGNNVSCDRLPNVWYPAGTTFTFTNPAGFGTCGQYKASGFKYAWDNSPARSWTGSEPDWSVGSLAFSPAQTGIWYLHLRSYNAEGVPNETALDLGPYKIDTEPPAAVAVTDDGAFQANTAGLHAEWTASSDAGSGICEYQYAVGTSPADPGSGYIVGWRSAGTATQAAETGLTLAHGSVCYWYVRAVDCAGNYSSAVSDGIAIVPGVSAGVAAAKLLPDGSPAALASRAATAVFDTALYVQDPGGCAGIKVQPGAAPQGIAGGAMVDVGGVIRTSADGERYIDGTVCAAPGSYDIRPLGMNNKWLGGAGWNYNPGTGAGQAGVSGGAGLNNIGTLVKVWGKVNRLTAEASRSWALDADPGWPRQGQWAYGVPAGLGGAVHGYPDPAAGFTGSRVFGVNLSGDYSLTVGGPYYLTMGPVDCSGWSGTKLSFRRWLNTDYQPYVYASVQVSTNGSSWTTVWNNGTSTISESAWSLQTYDIGSVADGRPAVYVRWGYQVASGAWAYSGWNIDDVALAGEQASETVEIDDGSGAAVKVAYPPGADIPADGSIVSVVGISSCLRDPGGEVRPLVLALP